MAPVWGSKARPDWALVACQDNAIRLIEGSSVLQSVPTSSSPTAMVTLPELYSKV
ncbi:hypothetical protein HK101_005328, partial [Irineochytrium annulatum]